MVNHQKVNWPITGSVAVAGPAAVGLIDSVMDSDSYQNQ